MNQGDMALESVSVREFAKNMRDGQGGAIKNLINPINWTEGVKIEIIYY